MKFKSPPINVVPLMVVMMAPTMVGHAKMQVLDTMVKTMTPQDPLTVVRMAQTMVAEVMGSNMAKMYVHVKMQVLDWMVMAISIFNRKVFTTILRPPIVTV